MVRYANLSGNSGVLSYQIEEDSITVQFSDYSQYVYSYRSAGQSNVEHMKQLAREGRGLNSFIMRRVKHSYE